jgi:gliding motility-associated-like protein
MGIVRLVILGLIVFCASSKLRSQCIAEEQNVNGVSVCEGSSGNLTSTGCTPNTCNLPCQFDPATCIVTVVFNGTHTFVSDLHQWYLIGPNGCGTLQLHQHVGAGICNGGDNFSNLTFTNGANSGPLNICTQPVPLGGTWAISGSLNSIGSCDINAAGWAVQVFDCIGADVGFLTSVSITFACPGCNGGIPVNYAVSGNAVINDNSCSPNTAATLIVPPAVTPQVNWYNTASGGASLGAGNSFNPGALPAGEYTFYANCECPSQNDFCGNARTPVTYTVYDTPEILNTMAECQGGTVTITVEAAPIAGAPAGCFWQYSFDGGASWSDSNIATGIPAGGPPRQIRVRNSCNTSCISPVESVPIPPDCILCPELDFAPPNLTIIDSECSIFCNLEGGTIIPENPSCPAGSILMFFNDPFSTTGGSPAIPAYDQEFSMTVYYRCVCEQDPTTVSPANTSTTQPGMCDPPVVSFEIAGPNVICVGDVVLVTFTGTANPGAEFIWDFDGGIATLLNSEGPHEVYWDTGGNKVISLSVTQNGCTEFFSLPVTITEAPDAIITQLGIPCPGQPIMLNGSTSPINLNVIYEWMGPNGYNSNQQNLLDATDEGTYTLTVYLNGCPSDTETIDITFAPEPIITIDAPALDVCDGGSITLTASGAFSYSWFNQNTSQNLGTSSGINPIITETTTFLVEGTSFEGCIGTAEITIYMIPAPELDITMDGQLCLLSDITLEVTGTDTYVWEDEPSNTSAIRIVSPGVPGTYTYTVTGTDAATGCTGTESITFIIDPAPDAMINPFNPVACEGESLVLNASGGATYEWDQGLGTDPTAVISPTETTTYSVTVTDTNGCSSVTSTTVEIVPQIDVPEIFCGVSTGTSVSFFWNPVNGATNITVDILSGHTGQVDGNSIQFDNLVNGESVTIRVTAEGPFPCPDTFSELTCTAVPCPAITVNILPVNDICLSPGSPAITLESEISGGDPNLGTYEWTGPGITDAENGIFDPVLAGPGQHQFTLIYNEELCFYTEFITINVYPVPVASFTLSNNPICVDSSTIITFTGNVSANATFTWDFDSGTASPGTGPGPHTVSWNSNGTKVISLSVTDNGCISEPTTQNIQIDSPLPLPTISCGTATTTSVVFEWTDVVGAGGYNVVVLTGQTGNLSGNTYTVNNLIPDELVSIQLEIISNSSCGNQFVTMTCAALSCPAFNLLAEPIPDICLNASSPAIPITITLTGNTAGAGNLVFSGPGIAAAGQASFDPLLAGIGLHNVTITYTEGPCEIITILPVQVFSTPAATFNLSEDTICVATAITIETLPIHNNMQFTWDFDNGSATPGTGAGPQTVSWSTAGTKTVELIISENGCSSPLFSLPVIVTNPVAAPLITCSTNTENITFSWADIPGVTGFDAIVITGPSGTLSGNSYAFTGLNPGDAITIEVTALTNNPCGPVSSELTCVAEDCPAVLLDFEEILPICLSTATIPITLNLIVTPQNPSGTISWVGLGITDTDTGIFDPSIAGPGVHVIGFRYTEGNCSYTGTGEITIYETPTGDFTVTSPICLDESSTITYTGTAGSGAQFDWGFDNGNAIPGSGEGPHDVSWASSGSKTLSLQVTENGCTSEPFEQTVAVVEPMADPLITCETNTSSIIFSWNTDPMASGQTITLLNGPMGTQTGNSYTITGLTPGISATLQVEFINPGPCSNTIAELTCIAQDCEDIEVLIDPVSPICLLPQSTVIQLNANINPNSGNGVLTWSGDGISDPDLGSFDPGLSGVGSHTITATYVEDNCVYESTTIIIVNPTPIASFSLESPVCIGQASALTYTGDSNDGSFAWDFDNGIPNTGAANIPDNVTWDTPGNKTVGLVVTKDGCPSALASFDVQVEEPLPAPVIQCNGTLTSVTFTWEAVPGASGYIIIVDNGNADTIYTTSHLVEPLATGSSVNFQIVAIGNGPCGNSVPAETTCVAVDCPDINVNILPIDPICLTDLTPDMTLSVQISPGPGNGSFTWSGPGIINANTGVFSAKVAGAGEHLIQVIYRETACTYTSNTTIRVGLTPSMEVEAKSPSCFGFRDGSIEIITTSGGTAPIQYSLNNGTFSGTTLYPSLGAGVYTLVVKDGFGCSTTQEFRLIEPPRLLVDLGGGITVSPGTDVNVNANATIPQDSISQYLWMADSTAINCPLCASISLKIQERTSVSVQITDSHGCTADDRIMIDILKIHNAFVPGGFSPNGDGINDTFTIYGGDNIKEIKFMEIFDRWGERVFIRKEFPPNLGEYGWDGFHQGKLMIPATFAYSILVEFNDGTIKKFFGEVSLMR